MTKKLSYNFLAEKIVLKLIILNPEVIEFTFKILPIEAFYFKNHQEIYKTLLFMYKNNINIDILSLTIFLQENNFITKAGGIQILLELISSPPNLIYFEDYISLVRDKFLRRSVIKIGYKIVNTGYITNMPLEQILDNFKTELDNLTNTLYSKKTSTSIEILTQIFYKLKKNSINPSLPGLTSGFINLDVLTQGFQKSDLIIIAGRPSVGKTALTLNIGFNILKLTKLPVLFFSLEMSKEQIMYRVLASESNLDQNQLKNGDLSENDWSKITKTFKLISKLPFFLDDNSNLSIQEIKSKIKTLHFQQTNIGIIIIDYLQLIKDLELKSMNRVQELTKITRDLKSLAREFNIPIIVLSQLNRNVDTRIDKKPLLSDLRESGSIEQDADLIIMLTHSEINNINQLQNSNLIKLIIAKQRNGPTGTVNLLFKQNQTKFVELN